MEIIQNKFAFFANFSETIRQLSLDKQGQAYQALCEYGIYGILPDDESLRTMCLMAKASIFKEDGRKNNGGNHNPTGRNQHTAEVNSGQSGQKRSKLVNSGQSGQILSETETETETEIKEKNIKKKFIKPTIAEIEAYCLESGNNIDAVYFFDFYESNGWHIGKNPMKDWKATVRRWGRNNKNTQDDIPLTPKRIGG